nr:hydrolase_like2 domain-containing protein [Tanacetum cinerariifolium]
VVNGALASVLKLRESAVRFFDPAQTEIWEIHFIPFSPLKARTKIWEIHFIPFSPLEKRTVLTYINGGGS